MKTRRSRNLALLAALFAPLLLVMAATGRAQTRRSPASNARVERGKYLVTISGCNDCHTPWKVGATGQPEQDMTRMLSGHPEGMKLPPPPPASGPWIGHFAGSLTAFAGPWGISYAANLTPDQNTGLGIWTEEMFIESMRTGKHMGTSRQIQPPMPWYWINKATDEDLKSIFAYFRTIPPITNHVPDYQEPPAASMPGAASTKPTPAMTRRPG